MANWFAELTPVLQALLATTFTWALTALGAATVFVLPGLPRRAFDAMLGFAAGVMVAASYWSLLAPAVALSRGGRVPFWIPPASGFLLGGTFLWGVDKVLPHLHPGLPMEEAEGVRTGLRRSSLLVLAITLHNIPEGLAVGVAFGALAANLPVAPLSGALVLALGIGLQNLPEGMAVSLPLRREGLSPVRCFWYGQLSGFFEPLAGVVGAAAVLAVRPLLPYALSFAAGAMLYVVVEELIPEAQRDCSSHRSTFGAMLGFALMMVLEIALT